MLKTLFIRAADPDSRRLMIVLHGLGDSMESYRMLPSEIGVPWLSYLLVNAPKPYGSGFSWFDFPGDPTPGAEQSYIQLHQLMDTQRERGFPTEQTVLFGFSQGCLMVWEAGVRYPYRFAGCIGVSGFMREPGQLLKLRSPVAVQQRFCITHGMMDDLIPIEESQKQVELVRKAGLQVEWKEIVKGHTIDPFGEMMLIRRFIEQFFAQDLKGAEIHPAGSECAAL